jgi:drug/metabolite transporter (DMT)-like permease
VLPVILSIAATLLFGAGSNLQRIAAAKTPRRSGGAIRLFLTLLHNRTWLAGLACATAALAFQMSALAVGSVIVVQAIITAGLVASLLMEAHLEGRRLRPIELLGTGLLVVGVTVLVTVGNPDEGVLPAGLDLALMTLVMSAVGVAGLVVARYGRETPLSARLLAGSAALCFAVDAAFLKEVGLIFRGNDLGALAWGLAGFGLSSMLGNVLVQRAYQMAPLRIVLPTLMTVEPVIALVAGLLVFHERLPGTVGIVGVSVGLTVMLFGVALDTRVAVRPPGAADPAARVPAAPM